MVKTFEAVLQKSPSKGGWTYVVMKGSVEYFGTKGLVKVQGTVDDQSRVPSWLSGTAPTNHRSSPRCGRELARVRRTPSPSA